jgi:hypothetical protein
MTMTELPQGTDPETLEPSENRSAAKQAIDIGKATFEVMKSILFIAPLALVLVVVTLALIGPSVGNIFSNIVSAL